MAQFGKLKMISESQLIIENGIRNYKRKNRGIMSPEFFQLAKTMDQNLAINFFIHPSSKSLFNTLFPSTPLFPKTGNQWLALDLEVENDFFTLDGIAFINYSIPDALTLIKSLKPGQASLHNFIPKNFTSYLSLLVGNLSQLEDNFKNYSRKVNIPLNKIDFSPLNSVREIGWLNYGIENFVKQNLIKIQKLSSNLKKPSQIIDIFKNRLIFMDKELRGVLKNKYEISSKDLNNLSNNLKISSDLINFNKSNFQTLTKKMQLSINREFIGNKEKYHKSRWR